MPDSATALRDQDRLYYERFDGQLRRRLQRLITPKIVEEHRRNPLGQHSECLERILNYLRAAPSADKFVLYEMQADRAFKIITMGGGTRRPAKEVDDRRFDNKTGALHAVFLLRLRDTFGYENP